MRRIILTGELFSLKAFQSSRDRSTGWRCILPAPAVPASTTISARWKRVLGHSSSVNTPCKKSNFPCLRALHVEHDNRRPLTASRGAPPPAKNTSSGRMIPFFSTWFLGYKPPGYAPAPCPMTGILRLLPGSRHDSGFLF